MVNDVVEHMGSNLGTNFDLNLPLGLIGNRALLSELPPKSVTPILLVDKHSQSLAPTNQCGTSPIAVPPISDHSMPKNCSQLEILVPRHIQCHPLGRLGSTKLCLSILKLPDSVAEIVEVDLMEAT